MMKGVIAGLVIGAAMVCVSAPAQAGGLVVGDAVIAAWTDGNFYTGTVKSVAAKQVEVAWTDGSEPTKVADDHTFAIPKKDKRKLKKGDLGLCSWDGGAQWYDCKVTAVKATALAVAYFDGYTGDVGYDGIVVPTGAAAKELKARAKAAKSGGSGSGGGGGTGGGGGGGNDNDGFDPTLRNDDDSSYDYVLECGGSSTNSSVDASSTVTLSKGCTLKVAGGEKKLKGNMECSIRSGSLSCR